MLLTVIVCFGLCSVVESTKDEQYCPKDVYYTFGYPIVWPATRSNTTIGSPCIQSDGENITRACIPNQDSSTGGSWGDPDVAKCSNDQLTKKLKEVRHRMSRSPITPDIISLLKDVTALFNTALENNTLYPSDMELTADLVDKVPRNVRGFGKLEPWINSLAEEFGKTVSALCSQEAIEIWTSYYGHKEGVFDISKSILFSVEQFGRSLLDIIKETHSLPQDNVTVTEQNLDFDVLFFSNNDRPDEGVYLSGKNASSTVIFPPVLSNISQQISSANKKKSFGYFRAQYDTIADVMNTQQVEDPDDPNNTMVIMSDILGASVFVTGDFKPIYNLSMPVTLVFQHKELQDNMSIGKVDCVFLDMGSDMRHVNLKSNFHHWSHEGCEVVHTNRTYTVCQCNHLTNFALIMDLFEVEISQAHETALSYISYIGGTLSIVGCLLSIFTYEFFRLVNERVRVHEMLALSMIFTQLIFFIGFERTKYVYVCQAFALLLHFFLTAMFCWMLVEGIHLYVSLIKVFRRHSNLKKYCVIGWGVPLVIVLISGIVFFKEYGGRERCWVTNRVLLIAFVPFVVLTILINLAVLILVIKVMVKSMKKSNRNKEMPTAKSGLKATVTLMPLLGLTWVFGFLSVDDDDTLIFTYLFTICNSLQGVFFFIFHCLLNIDVRRAFERRYRRQSSSGSSNPMKLPPAHPASKTNSPVETVEKDGLGDNQPYESLQRKRSSVFSVESGETNVTVDENCNGQNRSGSPEDEGDYLVWPCKSPVRRRSSIGIVLGIENGNNDVKEDKYIRDVMDAFNSVVPHGETFENDQFFSTHM